MLLTVDNGFAERKSAVNMEAIERVIAAYNKAKAVQKNAPEEYQVSHMWLPIYQRYMGEVMDVLARGDAVNLARIYGNFFRDHCTIGLHGMPCDMESTYFSGQISEEARGKFMADIMHRMQIWLASIGKTCPLSDLQTPPVGNPYGFFIDGEFYRGGVDYQHYYATMISRLTRGPRHRRVLELGGGIGGVAQFLIRDNADMTYIDVDLPETLALASFHLLHALPDKKIALYGEVNLERDDLSLYDAIMLPNFAIAQLRDDSVDLAFNSYSLAEMSLETVANYVRQFSRLSKGFIYHVNHTRIEPVKADDFPWDFDKFELVSRAPAMWNMANNPKMDEYEFLYKAKDLSLR